MTRDHSCVPWGRRDRVASRERGYAMAALLVGMSVMAILMSVALPTWRTAARREREAELIFRGEQYARAVELYQRKYAGAFPPNLDVLLNEGFLRKQYKDPITNDEFQLLYAGQAQAGQVDVPGPGRAGQTGQTTQGARGSPTGTPQPQQVPGGTRAGGAGAVSAGLQGGIMGVVSKSSESSLRLYDGRGSYNEWTFIATAATVQAGRGGRGASEVPGPRGRGGRRGASPVGGGRGTRPGRGDGAAPRGPRGFPLPRPDLELPGRGRGR